jgi:thiamine monophosphate kinase
MEENKERKENIKIAIDFDGVICKWNGVIRGHNFEKNTPVKDAVEAINWLLAIGYDLWIFTARPKEEWKDIEKWCRKFGIPDLEITNIKKGATIYLDDRAVRFNNWQDFCKLLK